MWTPTKKAPVKKPSAPVTPAKKLIAPLFWWGIYAKPEVMYEKINEIIETING